MALWRIRATVDDRPGFLSVLTASLALRAVNILAVQVHTTEAGAVDDFLVDAPDALGEADLIAAVERGRGRDAWVARAEAQGLVDPPTRALALAARVAHEPDLIEDALAGLLDGAVAWRPGATRPGFDGSLMRLADPADGWYEVTRRAPGFTPAEFARAQAMVDFAAVLRRRDEQRAVVLLPDGAEVLLRPAAPEDRPAVEGMHARCSADVLYACYGGASAVDEPGEGSAVAGTTSPVPPEAAASPSAYRTDRLLDPAHTTTLLAEAPDGETVVGLASLVAEGAIAQAALLVEDAWQRRGLGTALLRRLVAIAARHGYAALTLHVHLGNTAGLRTLHRLGAAGRLHHDGELVTATLPLDSPATGRRPHAAGR